MIAAPFLPSAGAQSAWTRSVSETLAMAERSGLIDAADGLCQCRFIGPYEQEAGRHGYFCVGAAISADED
jgi:hypothetical protein